MRRAARQLAEGDANAQRTLKGLEHLLRSTSASRAAPAPTPKSNSVSPNVSLNKRELDLACEAQRLEELKESLDALYAIMYNKKPE